ncbi:MAG: Mur ligase family protein [Candidatus Parcubacteria bacterium]|nr:Mur ligase family protein [Candidatus Parcubacteria bacterium]
MKEKNKKPARRRGGAHFIGICGAGMSALAVLYKEAGYKVAGSDEGFYEPILGYLKKNKINFYKKYAKKNIPKDVEMIVIGKHSMLTPENNIEVKKAFELQKNGKTIKSLPEALAMLTKEKENIIVAGSYGKSTCSALLSWCLMQNKKDPSYFIGAVPINFGQSSHLSKGKEFILEGDEYPSSNWDNTSKFLHFNPSSVLLISGEHDHLNVFPTEELYTAPYKKLVAQIPKDGLLVYSAEGKNNKEIKKYTKARTVSYTLDNTKSNWYASNIKYSLETSFDLMYKGVKVITIKTKLLGNHNIENIIGSGALLLEQKLIKPKEFAKAVASFHGIKRRIELISKKSSIPIYEGFGSSYEKTKVIFDALTLHFPKKRIVAVFEPHTFSWRNRGALKWYENIFNGVSEVIILPPPEAGKNTHEQLSFNEIYNAVQEKVITHKATTEKEALTIIKKIIKKNDLIALISSGSLLGLAKSVPKLF